MAMRRDDLGVGERVVGEPTTAPPTLDDALRVPDLEDADLVRSLWDDLATEAAVVEPAAPWAPSAVVAPVAPAAPAAPAAPVAPLGLPDPVLAPPTIPAPAPTQVPDDQSEPYVAPPTRRQLKRDKRAARDERRLEKLRLRRHRVLPRTVLGIASMLLFFGLGAGIAGAALYAYYDWRLSENEQRVGELSAGLERRLETANEGLDNAAAAAVQDIRGEMRPFRELMEQQGIANDLVGRLDGSVWAVETLDENGAPSVGSAFVAASDDSQSLLVTSYAVVAAGTTQPAPTITVRSGDESFEAQLYNWDPEHDLALLVLSRGGLEALPWAGNDTMAELVGTRVWVAQGFGGNHVSLSSGTVIDQSDVGLQHNAAVNAAFRGGPIVNGDGEVVGIASQAYAPLNYPSGAVSFAPSVQFACERVLSCSGDVPGAGEGN
jgi:S1-C subfamily serine protease